MDVKHQIPNCPVCHGSDAQPIVSSLPGGPAIVRCAACGLSRAVAIQPADLRERDRQNFDQWYNAHPLAWSNEDFSIYRPSSLRQLRMLEQLVGVGRLLDLGCGTGYLMKVAQDRGWQVTGTELISDCVRFLNDDLHIRCLHTDIADAEFPAASFDVVIMRQVLEHTLDPVQVIEKCRRWLRPGGLLFLLVPNERAIDLALLNWACSHTTGHHKHTTVCPPIHYWGFTQKALRLMLRRAGFAIRDVRGFWEGDAMFHPNIGWARPIRSRKDLQWNIQLMLKLSLLRPLGELMGRQSQLMVLARRS